MGNNIRKNVLFIVPTQYGYHTDSYKYCELLGEKYDVSYIGLSMNKPVRESKKVDVLLAKTGRFFFWRYALLKAAWRLNRKKRFDKIFIYAFPLCSLFILLFPKEKMIMDIRTSFIEGKIKSFILNRIIGLESKLFNNISVISLGIIDFLSLNRGKCHLLPLGGDDVPYYDKEMDTISLLYVGTFYDRHIEKTVEGLSLFRQQNANIKIEYTIIGIGSVGEVQKIIDAISAYGLKEVVHYVGEKRHEELVPFYKTHNVGVSYIPLTPYYDCQPPTKTYEYLLNTMAVLATPTTENKKLVNKSNGVLLAGDSAEDFANGIRLLYEKRKSFDFKGIYTNAKKYSWDNILNNYLINIVEIP